MDGTIKTPAVLRVIWPRMLVVLITLLVFAPSIQFEFNGWDDRMVLADNPRMLQPMLASLWFYWSHQEHHLYVPLTQTMWWLTAQVARVQSESGAIELNPAAFHLLNLFIHVVGAVICFELLRTLLKSIWPAALGALIFAVHPVQVETVCWTAATKDLLAGMFGLSALLCANRPNHIAAGDQVAETTSSTRSFIVASVLFVLAMLSKPSAVVLPVVMLIIDRLILGRPWRATFTRVAIWIVLAIPIVIIAKLVQPGHAVATVALPQRFLVAGDAVAFYLWKLIWPLNLAFDYGRTPSAVLSGSSIWLTALVPLIIGAAALMFWNRLRIFAIALPIFVAALFPVLGLAPFDFQIYSTVGDHYLYLAMLGPALLMTWLSRDRHGAIVVAALIAVLSVLSARQVWTWRDLESVSVQAIKVTPTSWASHNNLSSALAAEGKIDQAIAAASRAVELRPDLRGPRESLAGSLVLRGDAHAGIGNRDAAIAAYRQAIDVLPDSALAWTNLAATYAEAGDYDGAIEAYEKAIAFDPASEQARAGLDMVRKLKQPK